MEDPEAAAAPPQVAFKKRSGKGKANIRKRAPTPPPVHGSDSDFTSSEDEQGRRVKRRKMNGGVTASSTASTAPQEQERLGNHLGPAKSSQTDVATKASNWYDEEKDKELRSQDLLGTTRPRAGDGQSKPGAYTGVANYQSFIQKNPNAPTKQIGPLKVATNVRTITVTDYAPDVCKE